MPNNRKMENQFDQRSRKIRATAIVLALTFHAAVIVMAAGGKSAPTFDGIKEKVINVFSPAEEDMKSDFKA